MRVLNLLASRISRRFRFLCVIFKAYLHTKDEPFTSNIDHCLACFKDLLSKIRHFLILKNILLLPHHLFTPHFSLVTKSHGNNYTELYIFSLNCCRDGRFRYDRRKLVFSFQVSNMADLYSIKYPEIFAMQSHNFFQTD